MIATIHTDPPIYLATADAKDSADLPTVPRLIDDWSHYASAQYLGSAEIPNGRLRILNSDGEMSRKMVDAIGVQVDIRGAGIEEYGIITTVTVDAEITVEYDR